MVGTVCFFFNVISRFWLLSVRQVFCVKWPLRAMAYPVLTTRLFLLLLQGYTCDESVLLIVNLRPRPMFSGTWCKPRTTMATRHGNWQSSNGAEPIACPSRPLDDSI